VGAASHLAPGDFSGLFPQFRGNQIFELARADYIGAFADDETPGAGDLS